MARNHFQTYLPMATVKDPNGVPGKETIIDIKAIMA
jgi:hypothetical protein